MRVGVICGDYYHPAEVVIQGVNTLECVKSGEVRADFITETPAWNSEQMQRYDVVLISKGNSKSPTDFAPWLTDEVQRDFVNFVENGGSLLVIHSGTVGYNEQPLFRNLIGGAFRHHPKPGPVAVNITDSSVLPGAIAKSFTVHDEHYEMEMFHDDMTIFMASTAEGKTEPAGWTRQQGRGKVCVLTPGHYVEVWLEPDYQEIICGALKWCGES